MLRDTRRVDLSGKSVVRTKIKGNRFELIVNPELALKYKMGLLEESFTLDDILEVDEIFQNASKGERAPDEILEHCFETTEFSIAVSIGVSPFKPEEDQIEEILDRVDRSLYQAKREGRNRVVVSK